MNIEALNTQSLPQFQSSKGSDAAAESKKKAADGTQAEKVENKQIQPEELLDQIKGMTEDGVYSVRFENDSESNALVVKVVDRESDEVIRQIPPEELLDLTKRLNDLRGNIVNTEG